MKVIEYYIKDVYGNPLCYIKNPADAELVKQITGKKTLDARLQTAIQNLTGGLVKFQQVMWPLIMLMFVLSAHAAEINNHDAVRTILGEAGNQGYRGMLGVADVIRNRGTLQGCFGLHNPIVDKQPEWAWKLALKAWNESATNDITHGAKYFENVKAFGMPKWAHDKTITVVIKDQTFFK